MAIGVEEVVNRAESYGLLSRLYWSETTEEILQGLQVSPFSDRWRACSSQPSEALPVPSSRVIEELACEFARLFLGPGHHVAPYESVHRTDLPGGGQLWGEATQRVKRFLEHHGLKLSSSAQQIPDHIALEFEFMRRLVRAEAEAFQCGGTAQACEARDAQRRFFFDHPLVWVPAFCQKALAQNPHAFYEALLHVTLQFLDAEREWLRSGQAFDL